MVSAIVLAAGLSSRMGSKNKLLLPFKNKTILNTVIDNIILSGVEDIIVVTGNDAGMILESLKNLPVKVVFNAAYKKGMTSSIQEGIPAAKGEGYMICLGDMPFISAENYRQLINFFEEQYLLNKRCICLPSVKNEKANPVIFSSFYREEILQHTNMKGCKEIIRLHRENVCFLEMTSNNTLKDIDTLEDYERAVLPDAMKREP